VPGSKATRMIAGRNFCIVARSGKISPGINTRSLR
jgi:hypothetical protein